MQKKFGKKKVQSEKITSRLLVWITPSLREQLDREAEAAGYQSLGAYVREMKLGGPAPSTSAKAAR